MMKITVLSENTAGKNCRAEHGLSYLIEADQTILWDTGASDLFLENARQLGIDLEEVRTVVLSHGHDDHTGGLPFLKNKKLLAHPDAFIRRFRKTDGTPLGLEMTREEIEKSFDLITSIKPYRISERIWFLGEIPRENDFEARETAFTLDNGADDFIMDDSALAITGTTGLTVISGCAHAGICNTVEYARKVTGQQTVKTVIGGFHLKKDDELTRKTIQYLKQLGVQQVIPSHCTMLPALAAFYSEWNFMQMKAGNVLTLDAE